MLVKKSNLAKRLVVLFTQLVLSYGPVMIFQIGGKLMRGVPL